MRAVKHDTEFATASVLEPVEPWGEYTQSVCVKKENAARAAFFSLTMFYSTLKWRGAIALLICLVAGVVHQVADAQFAMGC